MTEMSAGHESYQEERDNFFCLTCLLFNIGNTTLRSYFKNTWPKVNGTGVAWCDKPEDGARFLALVTGLKLTNHEKAAVQNGDTNEWDLTLLVKLLMHSKFASPSSGFVLPKSQEYDWLDEIREIRNTLIGHAKETMLPKAEFSAAWKETSDILEKFGATKEEISAVLNDIERTRREVQERKMLEYLLAAQREACRDPQSIVTYKLNVTSGAGSVFQIGDIAWQKNMETLSTPDTPQSDQYNDDDGDPKYVQVRSGNDQYCHTQTSKDLGYYELQPCYKKTYLSGKWKPKSLSEVVTTKVTGIIEEDWSREKLFSDPDGYLNRMASSGGEIKAKVEQKFLQEILPSLEGECKKSDHHSDEIYQILAKLSCCEHSQSTVKHSLYLLRHLLTKDKLELSNARTIWRLEKILRGSFAGKEGLFNLESSAAQRLRLTVYSKVLCLLAICRCKGFLTFRSTDLEEREDAKVLLQNLSKCFCDKSYKKKDRLQLVAELTLTCLKWIFTDKKPIAKLKEALECFKKFLPKCSSPSNPEISCLVQTLCGYGKFCLQVTLCSVEHEMRNDKKALFLLFGIVDFVRSEKSPDWKIFITVFEMLANAAMTNRDKDIRLNAGWKLAEFLQKTNIKKTPELMEAIERKLSQVLFSPDLPVRTALLRVFSADPSERIPDKKLINYLCWFYKNQALEKKSLVRESKTKLVYKGRFQGKLVAIKTTRPSMQNLVDQDSEEGKCINSAFITEAYFLRRLNEATRHPNIIHLKCCNTVRNPYHLITEFMTNGNLLNYLRHECRSELPLTKLEALTKWCLEVVEALLFLSKYSIVHKKIMASNVLVGEDEVCKLSGFSSAEQILETESDAQTYSCVKFQLDSPGIVRWLAPEVLREGRYSKSSDTWAFGVLLYEVFSLGCKPFGFGEDERPNNDDSQVLELIFSGKYLPKLSCFKSKVYQLMETCWAMSPSERSPLEHLKQELINLQLEFIQTDARFPERPPNFCPEEESSNKEEIWRKIMELKGFLKSEQQGVTNEFVSSEGNGEDPYASISPSYQREESHYKDLYHTTLPPRVYSDESSPTLASSSTAEILYDQESSRYFHTSTARLTGMASQPGSNGEDLYDSIGDLSLCEECHYDDICSKTLLPRVYSDESSPTPPSSTAEILNNQDSSHHFDTSTENTRPNVTGTASQPGSEYATSNDNINHNTNNTNYNRDFPPGVLGFRRRPVFYVEL